MWEQDTRFLGLPASLLNHTSLRWNKTGPNKNSHPPFPSNYTPPGFNKYIICTAYTQHRSRFIDLSKIKEICTTSMSHNALSCVIYLSDFFLIYPFLLWESCLRSSFSFLSTPQVSFILTNILCVSWSVNLQSLHQRGSAAHLHTTGTNRGSSASLRGIFMVVSKNRKGGFSIYNQIRVQIYEALIQNNMQSCNYHWVF